MSGEISLLGSIVIFVLAVLVGLVGLAIMVALVLKAVANARDERLAEAGLRLHAAPELVHTADDEGGH